MSDLSIAPFLPFERVVLRRQSVSKSLEPGEALAWIEAEPNERLAPKCSQCGTTSRTVHSWETRAVRDLSLGQHQVYINCRYRKLACRQCAGIRVEDLGFCEPYQRVTKRLARSVQDLCRLMTVQQVSEHVHLDWKLVQRLEKQDLEARHGETNYDGLRLLAIDEIAVRKGQNYLTVVLDYESGRVVWVGEGRTIETVKGFFNGMSQEQKDKIEAVSMDMWPAFMTAVRAAVPQARIVFDAFHVVASFGKVIDQVRNDEYRKASKADKEVLKGSRFLLLKNDGNIKPGKEREQLNRILSLNAVITQMLILRDMLKTLWHYRKQGWAKRKLEEWCGLAASIGHPALADFIKKLRRHEEGILNHCAYPIHNGKLEGVNNKIKVIKRQAYGFRDDRYFSLKIIDAFALN
jgi:transposase